MTEVIEEELGFEHCVLPGEVEVDEVPEVSGSEAAFNRYIDEGRRLAKGDVVVCRADTSLAFHNVDRGVKAVLERREMVERLPDIDAERLFELPNLALAVVYGAAVAARAAGQVKASNYRQMLSRANAVRRTMLLSLEACASVGIVPNEEVKPIRRGQGSLDLAGDVVTLVALFRKHADVLKNKTPVTAAQLHEASEVGTALLTFLKPKGTPVIKDPRSPEQSADDRDRLWTLLVHGHSDLRRVASFLFGDASSHVPALQSRLRVGGQPTKTA